MSQIQAQLPKLLPTGDLGINMTRYADQQVGIAESYINDLQISAQSIVPQPVTAVFPTSPTAPPLTTALAPSFNAITWTAPGLPTAFTGTLNIDNLFPAPFDQTGPVLAFGAAPAPFSETAPSAPGVDLQFQYPDLTVNLPAPPSLLSISTYAFGGVDIPTLAEDVPVLNLVAPSIREYTPGTQYTSGLLTTLKNTLQDRIENGGTGLPADVENALWDRGRDREYRQMRDALADLERMETLGFSFPPGVYVDARVKIQTEMGYNAANISREIMIEQAKLELSNILKALDTATAVEGKLIDYTNSIEQRAFESAKYATQAGVEIYNAQVRSYAAYVDAYKTKVAIYEAQIRGQLAKVEAYKAEIEAEQAKAQTNTALVQQYKVQVDAALSAIEIFKAEVGAIQAKAEIEKLKVEIFGEQVKAYGAKVNAFTANVEGFRASIQAESSKQEAFKAAVDAYSAQVSASTKIVDAKIAQYRGLIEAKTLEWNGYKSQADAEAARVNAIANSQTAEAEVYKAEISGISGYNEVLTKQWQATLDQNQRVAEIGVAAAKANAEQYLTVRGLLLDSNKVGAQVMAQLGAAALNAVNYSNSSSVSYGASDSNSSQWSESYTASI